jgi:hypothetical protein
MFIVFAHFDNHCLFDEILLTSMLWLSKQNIIFFGSIVPYRQETVLQKEEFKIMKMNMANHT